MVLRLAEHEITFLPQLTVMSQSDWPICQCQQERRQHCFCQHVTQWSHTERIVLLNVDIVVKTNCYSAWSKFVVESRGIAE